MVGGPALAGFDHNGGLQAQAKSQEVVMDSPDGQKGWYRHGGSADATAAAIGEEQDLAVGANGRLRLKAKTF
jgi:hypothetical protein